MIRQFSLEPRDRGSELSLLFADLERGLVEFEIKDDDEITDDCLEKCPKHAKAATSKAEVVDLPESLADVSTYITAPDCLDIARACSEEMLKCAWEWTDLMSDLHPTNTMGVEGKVFIRLGTQVVTAFIKEEREVIEKQRRKTSAEIKGLHFN